MRSGCCASFSIQFFGSSALSLASLLQSQLTSASASCDCCHGRCRGDEDRRFGGLSRTLPAPLIPRYQCRHLHLSGARFICN